MTTTGTAATVLVTFKVGPAQMSLKARKGDTVEILRTFANGYVQIRAYGRMTATVPASFVEAK